MLIILLDSSCSTEFARLHFAICAALSLSLSLSLSLLHTLALRPSWAGLSSWPNLRPPQYFRTTTRTQTDQSGEPYPQCWLPAIFRRGSSVLHSHILPSRRTSSYSDHFASLVNPMKRPQRLQLEMQQQSQINLVAAFWRSFRCEFRKGSLDENDKKFYVSLYWPWMLPWNADHVFCRFIF